MMVLSATEFADLAHVERLTGRRAERAHEPELRDPVPGCRVGAMPRLHNLYVRDAYVGEDLAEAERIAFDAGSCAPAVPAPLPLPFSGRRHSPGRNSRARWRRWTSPGTPPAAGSRYHHTGRTRARNILAQRTPRDESGHSGCQTGSQARPEVARPTRPGENQPRPAESIQRVLVRLDSSALAEGALPHAVAAAGGFEAEAVLLRVVGNGATTPPRQAAGAAAWRLEHLEADRYLADIAGRLRAEALEQLRVGWTAACLSASTAGARVGSAPR